MVNGLILLVFIGILVAIVTLRLRRRMGLGMNSRLWGLIILWAVILGLVLYAASLPGK